MGLFNLFGKKKEQNKESSSDGRMVSTPPPLETAPSSGSSDSLGNQQDQKKQFQEPESVKENEQTKTNETFQEQSYQDSTVIENSQKPGPGMQDKYGQQNPETNKQHSQKESTSQSQPKINEKKSPDVGYPVTGSGEQDPGKSKQQLSNGQDQLLNTGQEQKPGKGTVENKSISAPETEKNLQNFSDSTSEKKKIQQIKQEEERAKQEQTNSQIDQDLDLKEILEEELPPPPQINLAKTRKLKNEEKEAIKGLSYPEKIELLQKGKHEKSEEESLAGFYKRAFPKDMYPQTNFTEGLEKQKTEESPENIKAQPAEVQETAPEESEFDELFITAKNFRELSEFIDSISSEIRVSLDSVTRASEFEYETDTLLNSWKEKLDISNKNIEKIEKIVFK
ncbi:MAG: hypothetical protein ACOCQG_03515 [Candidatus Nanoarchaeia archaeon]